MRTLAGGGEGGPGMVSTSHHSRNLTSCEARGVHRLTAGILRLVKASDIHPSYQAHVVRYVGRLHRLGAISKLDLRKIATQLRQLAKRNP